MAERRTCSYCGHDLGDGPGHYVPPGFGSPGFAACEQLCDDCKTAKEVGQQSTGP